MNETCPLATEEVCDDAIPEECLPCWIAQRNPKYTYVRVTSRGMLDEIGTFRVQRKLRRARTIGRRIVTELLINDWPGPGDADSDVVRTAQKDVACLREIGEK